MKYLPEQVESLLQDIRFAAMSAYRLNQVEYNSLQHDTARLATLKEKINRTKTELEVLAKLKNCGEISDEEFKLLQNEPFYHQLTLALSDTPTNLSSVKNSSITDWEKEFEEQACAKVKNCKDRYELANVLNQIGWLGKLDERYTKSQYRGDLIKKISFKKLSLYNEPLKTTEKYHFFADEMRFEFYDITCYTSRFGIRSKIIEFCHEHRKNPTADKYYSQKSEKKPLESAYQEYSLLKKKSKIEESNITPEIIKFRQTQ